MSQSAHQKDSNFMLSILLSVLAKEVGLNPDNITLVANGQIRGNQCKRYEMEGIEKYMVTFGKEFIILMDNKDSQGVFREMKLVLSSLHSLQKVELNVPIVTVKDTEFQWEYVVRAKHMTGIIITKVSNFPNYMEMKQEIHEETATVLEHLITGGK